ncbi:DUF348 domain-containing protein [Candidatus Saccharibacteria bacterium]|nr:DUF348 domain-containing protein [Candidatus Saccharibacteria bacterium]
MSHFQHYTISKVSAADSASTAKNGRLITIHDRGEEKVILTKTHTLKEALEEAHINLDNNDRVEPKLSEQLVASAYTVNIYRARPVIVVDGQVRQKVMTAYQTSDQIAKDAGIELHDEDKTVMRTSDDIVSDGAGLELQIERATEFTFILYGKKTTAYSQARTVGEMLKSKDITLAADDTLSIPSDAVLTNGMTVELWRNGKQTITEEQAIAFETEKIQDADRPVGFREVKTQGSNGKKSVTYEVEMKNGQELSRKEIQSVVMEQPKKQVETVGSKPVFSGSFAEALAKLRACESGGNYANKKNPSYRGAYQYGYSTWGNKYGIYDPADATPAQQDQAAWETYQRRGWQPWPHCGSSLPDTYR